MKTESITVASAYRRLTLRRAGDAFCVSVFPPDGHLPMIAYAYGKKAAVRADIGDLWIDYCAAFDLSPEEGKQIAAFLGETHA